MTDRLPAHLEASSLLRRVDGAGGFGAVLHRGDRERGSLLILILERGAPRSLLERQLQDDFTYQWAVQDARDCDWTILRRDRTRIDPDCWLIELDVPDAERFTAEMTFVG
ncbi:MAG: DUF1491 family protein [Sphingomicrobium sp.]